MATLFLREDKKLSNLFKKVGMVLKILFIGDIVGRPGRQYVTNVLQRLLPEIQPDLVIANGENAAKGKGLSKKAVEQLYDAGIEIVTLGNHAFDQREVLHFINDDLRIVRPANYPPETPGRGYTICRVKNSEFLILNMMGRAFLSQLDCPFRTVEHILSQHPSIRHILVDMHAEVTSEKLSMGWFLDGRVSAVVGTHTHVPTADARILPKGTAYITDVGMVGPKDGILGMDRNIVIQKMRTQLPARFEVAAGPSHFCAVEIELDDHTGKSVSIRQHLYEEGEHCNGVHYAFMK